MGWYNLISFQIPRHTIYLILNLIPVKLWRKKKRTQEDLEKKLSALSCCQIRYKKCQGFLQVATSWLWIRVFAKFQLDVVLEISNSKRTSTFYDRMAKDNGSKVSSLWRSIAILAVLIILIQYIILISQCNSSAHPNQPESLHFYFPDLLSASTSPNTRIVLGLTLFSTLTSGLGAVPFFFVSNLSHFSVCIYNSIAAG